MRHRAASTPPASTHTATDRATHASASYTTYAAPSTTRTPARTTHSASARTTTRANRLARRKPQSWSRASVEHQLRAGWTLADDDAQHG